MTTGGPPGRVRDLVGRVHEIDTIDLNDTSAVTLTLTLADVVDVARLLGSLRAA